MTAQKERPRDAGDVRGPGENTDASILIAIAPARNPTPAAFTRMQITFAHHGCTLHRVRSLADVRVSYLVRSRGDFCSPGESRHFATWTDVLDHLAQISGAA